MSNTPTNIGGLGGGRGNPIPVGVAPWAAKGPGLGLGLAQGPGLGLGTGVPVGVAPWATTAYIPSCKPTGSNFSMLQGPGLGVPRQTMLPPIGNHPFLFLEYFSFILLIHIAPVYIIPPVP